jgi:hypothetical protein
MKDYAKPVMALAVTARVQKLVHANPVWMDCFLMREFARSIAVREN